MPKNNNKIINDKNETNKKNINSNKPKNNKMNKYQPRSIYKKMSCHKF